MIITAKDSTMNVISIVQTSGGVRGVMCESVQITMETDPTDTQLADLMEGPIYTEDGRELVGYNGLANVQLTLYRKPTDAKDLVIQQMEREMEEAARLKKKAEEDRVLAEAAAKAAKEAQQAAEIAAAEAEQQRMAIESEKLTIEAEKIKAETEATTAREEAEAKTIKLVSIANALPDELAIKNPDLYPQYEVGMILGPGQRFRVADGSLFKSILENEHTTQADWNPETTPSVYNKVRDPRSGPEPYVKGTGYEFGIEVTHIGGVWLNMLQGMPNTWEPGSPGIDGRYWERVRDA